LLYRSCTNPILSGWFDVSCGNRRRARTYGHPSMSRPHKPAGACKFPVGTASGMAVRCSRCLKALALGPDLEGFEFVLPENGKAFTLPE